MNVQDISAHWVALHEALGLGAPIADEAHYERMLQAVDALIDDVDSLESGLLGGLVALLTDHIRATRLARTRGPTSARQPVCWRT